MKDIKSKMIKVKDGVVFKILRKEMYSIFPLLQEVISDCVITSAQDGTHKKGSLHYKDYALDLRSKHLSTFAKANVLQTLKEKLEPFGYDVLLEGEGTANEHFHIEYDAKPKS